MISVAAELAEMHPQTLRMYESRGLIEPKRSPKGTRLYSHKDVERLRRIQEMTAELGMNLAGRGAGVRARGAARGDGAQGWPRSTGAPTELKAEVERLEALRRELRAELVPYERGGQLIRHADFQAFALRMQPRHPGSRPSTRQDDAKSQQRRGKI